MPHISRGVNFQELTEIKYYKEIQLLNVDTKFIKIMIFLQKNDSLQSVVLIILLEIKAENGKDFRK